MTDTTDNAPEFMPVLERGAHTDPSKGACIMEYASFLSGEKWTDHPTCTNRTIATLAQVVNDSLSDEHRHLLLPLLPRLMATGPSSLNEGFRLSESLRGWIRDRTPEAYRTDRFVGVYGSMVDALRGIIHESLPVHLPFDYDPLKRAMDEAMVMIQLLTDMLDEYDRLTGRTNVREITPEEYAACYALTAKKA